MTGWSTLCVLGLAAPVWAWAPDPEVARGHNHFYNLEFDQAIRIFRELVKKSPGAAHLRNHLAQSILYREMLRSGALETELVTGGNAFLRREKMNPTAADQREFDTAISEAMRLSQERLAVDRNDKAALYQLGVTHGLRANYNFLVRKAWMDALKDATQSRKLHNRVTDLDPSMVDARLTQGVHDYIVGSLPWSYKLLGFLAGFRGDKQQGIRAMELVYQKGENNRWDAAILLATVHRRERRPADAVPLLENLIARFGRNYLFRLELAQMHSDLGNKAKALGAIREVEKLKLAGTPGYDALPIEKVLYFRATVEFWYNDLDAAIADFLPVTARSRELDPNTGVTAWMRLGQSYDLKGQRGKAVEAYRRAMAEAPGSYRAKESAAYLRRPYRR